MDQGGTSGSAVTASPTPSAGWGLGSRAGFKFIDGDPAKDQLVYRVIAGGGYRRGR